MKINLKSLLKSKDRGIVSIPHYIFLLLLFYVGYFILTFILYAIFYFSWQAITKHEFPEPNYFVPLFFLIVGLFSFFTINKNLRVDISMLKKIPVIKNSAVITGLLIFIVLALFLNSRVDYLLSNKASNNSKPIVTQTPIPTDNPTSTSTPSPKLQQKTNSVPIVDSNPIIDCKAPVGSKCEGQSQKMIKSECSAKTNTYACCQIGNQFKIMKKSDCASNLKKQNIPIPTGNIFYPNPIPTPDPAFEAYLNSMKAEIERQDLALKKAYEEIQNRVNTSTTSRTQNKMLYDMCVGIVNDKYSNRSGQIIGQSGGVSGGVYYGTENRAYQDELSGCSILLK